MQRERPGSPTPAPPPLTPAACRYTRAVAGRAGCGPWRESRGPCAVWPGAALTPRPRCRACCGPLRGDGVAGPGAVGECASRVQRRLRGRGGRWRQRRRRRERGPGAIYGAGGDRGFGTSGMRCGWRGGVGGGRETGWGGCREAGAGGDGARPADAAGGYGRPAPGMAGEGRDSDWAEREGTRIGGAGEEPAATRAGRDRACAAPGRAGLCGRGA